jgi:hypothetical protein
MLRYYVWAFGERALSLVPGGERFYRTVGRIAKSKTQGSGTSFVSSLPVTKKVYELAAPGATIMDLGTGWFHHDAFLIHLVGDYRFVLFDIRDKAELTYIRNYLNNLLRHSHLIAAELGQEESAVRRRLQELLGLPSREAIYERCNFTLCITQETSRPFLPENSLDFVVSNCALVHIPPDILLPELVALHAMLKEGGYMYHHLGHDDHWAFHDPAMSWPSFNYMRYSERVWDGWFQSLEYHNRLVKPEWIEIFQRCGFTIDEYNTYITEESRDAVRRLPKVAMRFARYDIEELANIYSYVLVRKGGAERETPGTITSSSVALPTVEPA